MLRPFPAAMSPTEPVWIGMDGGGASDARNVIAGQRELPMATPLTMKRWNTR